MQTPTEELPAPPPVGAVLCPRALATCFLAGPLATSQMENEVTSALSHPGYSYPGTNISLYQQQ